MKFLARSHSFPRTKLRHPSFHPPRVLALAIAFSISISIPSAAQRPQPTTPPTPQTAPAIAQEPATPQPTPPAATPAPALPPAEPAAAAPPTAPSSSSDRAESKHDKHEAGEIREEELRQLLVGKQLFLRGGYLGDSISFNEHGLPIGHPAVGSFTLSGVEIEKVHLTKHKVELIGARYGLHFLGLLPNEDPTKAVDRIKITPKKKFLRITIDREQVVKEKKAREKENEKPKVPAAAGTPASTAQSGAPAEAPSAAPQTAETSTAPAEPAEPAAEQAADPGSVTSTTSPAHAAQMLRDALDRIFAEGLDDKERAEMPGFWQLYYQAQAAGVDYRPKDPNVFRSSAVDTQAKLVSSIALESNEYAQASGIAGPALYRVVVGADGKPGEIAAERPIGFGLDENAVSAIRKASFQPATKGGQPVAETLDLAVTFHIYSRRTAAAPSTAENTVEEKKPVLPGPYTVRAPKPAPEPAPDTAPAPSDPGSAAPAPSAPAPSPQS